MAQKRAPYVKPELMNVEFHIDPRVTLAASCKGGGDSNAANAFSTCYDATAGANCNNISPS